MSFSNLEITLCLYYINFLILVIHLGYLDVILLLYALPSPQYIVICNELIPSNLANLTLSWCIFSSGLFFHLIEEAYILLQFPYNMIFLLVSNVVILLTIWELKLIVSSSMVNGDVDTFFFPTRTCTACIYADRILAYFDLCSLIAYL